MKAATIIDCIKTHLPNHYTHIRAFSEANLRNPDDIAPYYSQLDPISIDVGIMEKVSDQIRLIRAPFQWSDIGSWASLDEFLPKDSQNNAIKGPVCLHESSNNIIVSDKKLISLSHVNDLIVVDSPDALLILPKNNDQSIKNLYEKLPDTVK
jgi:mannose-1-phosphate guanylyltransferase